MKQLDMAAPTLTLVALDKSVISRTRKLAGIFRAAAESSALELKVMDDGRDLTASDVSRYVAQGVGAFIIGASGIAAAAARIAALDLPAAFIYQDYPTGDKSVFVGTDDASIADAALKAIQGSRRWRSYAFLGAVRSPKWSVLRMKRFSARLRKLGHRLIVLPRAQLSTALARLPKPAAVFAANDNYAAEVTAACRKARIPVPEEVGVIGVDNDELICGASVPPLTSVEPDFEREGYEAAKSLAALLANRKTKPKPLMCGVKRVVQRGSLPGERNHAALVERALEYISANAVRGIGVADVSSHLRVSRSLLDLRFRQFAGQTVNHALTEARLAALKRELATSSDPISRICEHCGFGSENHPKKLFRQRFGVSMRAWRSAPA